MDCKVLGITKSQTQRSDFHFQFSVAHWYRICLSMQETRVPALLLEDPGSIPGSGRASGERIGYPLQYSWASLVAQLVKNPPAVQKTPVQSMSWEDPWRKERLPTRILAWRIPWTV